jgi:cell division septum initiation protein DivIVA
MENEELQQRLEELNRELEELGNRSELSRQELLDWAESLNEEN